LGTAARRTPPGEAPTAGALASLGTDYGTALTEDFTTLSEDVKARLARLDWGEIERSLGQWGYAKTPAVLSPAECAKLIGLYGEDGRFRSTVDMARYRFGIGEDRYFSRPLPPLVEALRRPAHPAIPPPPARRLRPGGSPGGPGPGSSPRRRSTSCSRSAGGEARPNPRRSCCATRAAATTACTRTSTATSCFPCSSRAS